MSQDPAPDPQECDDDGLDFEDVSLPVPVVQTMIRDSDDESSDSEPDEEEAVINFDNIDVENLVQAADPPGLTTIELNLSAQQQATLASPSPPEQKNKRKPLTKEQKQHRLEAHRMHILCLIWHCSLRNHWCNDPKVQATLRKLLTQRTRDYLCPKKKMLPFAQTESIKRGLRMAGEMWKINYSVTERGMKRALWATSPEDLATYEPYEDLETCPRKDDFQDAAKTMSGSRDVGAQLYCAFLRAAGIHSLDFAENVELQDYLAREPMPKNISDFRGHPDYVLPRHLKRNQVLKPGSQVCGTVAPVSKAPVERVYPRADVRVVHSHDKWFRLGRQVRPGERPAKMLVRRTQKNRNFDSNDDMPEVDTYTPAYTEEQTDVFQHPPVVNGRLPRNKFGNLEIYVPGMIPNGGAYLAHNKAVKAAYLLGIDYAPVVSGFEFRGRHGTAVMKGAVVAAEHAEAMYAVLAGFDDMQTSALEDRKRRLVLKAWTRFLKGLRIRAEIWKDVDEEKERRDAQNRIEDRKREEERAKKKAEVSQRAIELESMECYGAEGLSDQEYTIEDDDDEEAEEELGEEKSLQARALNCNDEATITLQQWAITIARNKGCMVLVTWSYQFDGCNGAETLYHESMLLVNRDGERIGRRQRGCLNKTPAESDIFSLKISDTTKIAVGLSLDIGLTEHQNPSDGPDTYDFATHVVQAGANLVVLSLASTSNQLIEAFTTKPEDPDMDTLCHWLSRLFPIFQSSLESSEIIVVLANRRRPAKMDSALFAGTNGKELLSVDTEKDKPSIWYWDGKRLIKDTTPAVPPVADLSVLHMRGRVMYGSEGLHKLDSASLVVPRPSLSLETGISPVEVASWDAKTPGGLTPISSGLRFNPEDLAQAQDVLACTGNRTSLMKA
ncbi:DNA repair protein rhp41 [Ceratocystis platani]|uniref:DNA repair protein rhp41 n=1 Tax=Ceratocystis fimbriata f. sp. platani TaxID=88771 RepID=A0A0F8BWT2_CERFI|nr:DNA repair protein rhp41 [Ceratocystis platani]